MWNASIQLPLKLQRKGFTEARPMARSEQQSWVPDMWWPPPRRPASALRGCWLHSAGSHVSGTSSTLPLSSLSSFLTPFALSDFDCSDPLGMESGEITSDQIMASSQYNPSWSPERSRLNYYENAWTPADDTNKEWIQVTHLFNTPRKTLSRRQPQSHRLSDESLSTTTSVQQINHRISVFLRSFSENISPHNHKHPA